LFGLTALLIADSVISREEKSIVQDQDYVVELVAYGRGGHGSSLNPSSAPHRLIQALAQLESLLGSQTDSGEHFDSINHYAIESICAGRKVNVTPGEASSRLRLWLSPSSQIESVVEEISNQLHQQIEIKIVDVDSSGESDSI
jgi:acetylornithine deacetylase/succinyl-diaminopimelate desuccinylase-like protein